MPDLFLMNIIKQEIRGIYWECQNCGRLYPFSGERPLDCKNSPRCKSNQFAKKQFIKNGQDIDHWNIFYYGYMVFVNNKHKQEYEKSTYTSSEHICAVDYLPDNILCMMAKEPDKIESKDNKEFVSNHYIYIYTS